MKKIISLLLIFLFNIYWLFAQECPYRINWKLDGAVTLASMGAGVYGLQLMDKKSGTDSLTLVGFDEANMKSGYLKNIDVKSRYADKVSDSMLAYGVLVPGLLLTLGKVRNDLLRVMILYLETMAITGMTYTLSAGTVSKLRPYVYSPEVSFKQRASSRGTYSFFAGHTAMTAAGTFFTAQVFSDYYPQSNFKYVLWSAASVATLSSAYCRYKKGYHFPEDIITGVVVGTLTGIGIPAIHKIRKENSKVSITPLFLPKGTGIAALIKF